MRFCKKKIYIYRSLPWPSVSKRNFLVTCNYITCFASGFKNCENVSSTYYTGKEVSLFLPRTRYLLSSWCELESRDPVKMFHLCSLSWTISLSRQNGKTAQTARTRLYWSNGVKTYKPIIQNDLQNNSLHFFSWLSSGSTKGTLWLLFRILELPICP